MRSFHCFVLVSAFVAAVGCVPPTAQSSSEIAARSETWQTAFNAADVDSIVALYAEDARLLPPNGKMESGHGAVRAAFEGMIAEKLSIRLETVEAFAASDLGHRVGTYVLTAPDGSEAERGKFIETWKKIGGEWRITNDIWNADTPAAPSGATVLFTHDVRDRDHWLAAWQGPDSRHADFAKHGVPAVRVFLGADSPHSVALLTTVADMDAFMAFLQSPEGATAKSEDGVLDATIRRFEEPK